MLDLDDGDIDDDFNEAETQVISNDPAHMTHTAEIFEVYAAHCVIDTQAGERIDKLAADVFSGYSRAQLQDWLKSGNLQVNGNQVKAKYRVKAGDQLLLEAKLEQHGGDKPENIALNVVYEDNSVVVINKPVGMVVHPGAGNWTGTLVNGLLYHYPNQAHLPRAGLVHRIDKNTSGLLVVGKTKAAQLDLQQQLKDKSVYRHYQCVVAGDVASLTRQRTIDAPIGRHRVQRTKMTVTSTGKPAVTHIMKITELNSSYSLLDVRLETGRTHQIRVHLSHIGHPIIGDNIYGNRNQLRAGLTDIQRQAILDFPRQALHAYKLGFIHPITGELIEVAAPLPEDMVQLVQVLSEH
ncbi:RluA family pseudouridine synthase [Psychrobacter lutiphocae]|uniref:RluA family pseudouridine synthase n=1 Tax=Psychrobacter lutiphocae TaxID=540500 RepID=UPI0012EAEB9E